MTNPSSDPSFDHEPHLWRKAFEPDASEEAADRVLNDRPETSHADRIDHGVWDEPGLSEQLSGPRPAGADTWRSWLEAERSRTSALRSWTVVLAAALTAGPLAIVGAFWGSGQSAWGYLSMVVFAPAVEELGKAALALWIVERRPFLFRSSLQIALCLLCAGAAFSIIENLLYLHVYIDAPSPELIRWRWTVCVALHMGCSLIVSGGLIRVWRDVWARLERPRLPLAFPFLIAGVVTHGAYNAFAIALSAVDKRF